jgi:hypothetical protein
MNAKTKTFLTELVDLCLEHGVFLDDSPIEGANEAVVGKEFEFRSDYKHPPGRDSIVIKPDVIQVAIEDARVALKTPKALRVYRQGKDRKSREWLASPAGKSWAKDRAKAHVFNLTTGDYMRLISKIEKTDTRYRYVFGHEEVKG